MKMVKALKGLLCLCGLGFLLSGCTLSQNSVKLHTNEEMQKIVEERYGDAELVGVEDTKSPKRRTFTYRDTKYGFTYQVVSRPRSVGMDGSTFYYDGAGATFYYEEPFLEYFKEQEKETFANHGIELCDDLDLPQNFEYPVNKKFSLKSKTMLTTTEDYEEDVKFAWDRVHAYKEVPELMSDYQITIYDSEKVAFIGTWNQYGFVTAETQRIEYFMSEAKSLAGISDITYLRKEKKKVKEVPGLSEQNLYEKRSTVNVYYFSYEGEEYFIVDLWVAQIGDNGGGIYQYYQNYKYYPVSN